MMRRVLVACALAALAQASPAIADDGRLVKLRDGRRIFLSCAGKGSPTVILESGYLGTSGAWFKVKPKLAAMTRVCAWDRPGLGKSDAGPEPRDGKAIAADLDATLKAARIAGPFVLVGHSAGALYLRLFSNLRPRDIAGMVLVDPTVEHQDSRFDAVFGPGAGSNAGIKARAVACLAAAEQHKLPSTDKALAACGANDVRTWRTAISEIDNLLTATAAQVDAGRRSYGALPLIVLSADGTYAGMPERARTAALGVSRGLHREVAARSSRGEERLVTGSSHMMIFDRPDAIVDAVQEVLKPR